MILKRVVKVSGYQVAQPEHDGGARGSGEERTPGEMHVGLPAVGERGRGTQLPTSKWIACGVKQSLRSGRKYSSTKCAYAQSILVRERNLLPALYVCINVPVNSRSATGGIVQ